MPRKRNPPVEGPAIDLPADLLEEWIPGPMDAVGVEAVFQKLKKAVIERALGAELGVHLSDRQSGQANHRNGHSAKTVLTDEGAVRIDVAIESIHARLRKIIVTRGHFPPDEAATALIWRALRTIAAEWSRPVQHWKDAMNPFALIDADRFTRPVP